MSVYPSGSSLYSVQAYKLLINLEIFFNIVHFLKMEATMKVKCHITDRNNLLPKHFHQGIYQICCCKANLRLLSTFNWKYFHQKDDKKHQFGFDYYI